MKFLHRKFLTFSYALLFAGIIISFSCRKEKPCDDCREINQLPIAIAGSDQIITLPADSILLDGSASNDPDGTISEWLWTKISGPASFAIAGAGNTKTMVNDLAAGAYEFELKIKDDGGLSAKDTVRVTVDDPGANQPPIANAGADTTVILPANTIHLDGSRSIDPDNNIIRYEWTKISGPSSFIITDANEVQTQVTNLLEGVYQFELKVTDAEGLFSKDVVNVAVSSDPKAGCDISDWPIVNLELREIGKLSEARVPIIGTAGNKIIFAGGPNNVVCSWEWELSSSVVDIYDIPAQQWTTAQLSKGRSNMEVASWGSRIFFAGGSAWGNHPGGGTGNVSYDHIDIYDASTNSWTVDHLSKARQGMSVATVGNQIIFAGGAFYLENPIPDKYWDVTDVVDIYNVSSKSWSSTALSVPRADIVSIIKGDTVYFIGGYGNGNLTNAQNAVDIYNGAGNTWSATYWTDEEINRFLTEAGVLNGGGARACSCGTSVDNNSKIIRVGFFDNLTGKCTIGILPPFPPDFTGASIEVNNKIYVAGGYSEDANGCIVLKDKVYIIE